LDAALNRMPGEWRPLVRIQVLGPVRLWRGEQEIIIGATQQRTILALLAAAAGQPLSRTEAISTLWDDQPPASAINIVQTCVKRLRRILEPDRPAGVPSTAIRATSGGYVMDTAAVDIDLVRFRRLVADATQAYQRNDKTTAAELLGRSIALWSGPPFADIPVLVSRPMAAALLGEKRAAVLRYGELMTAMGSAGDVLPLLEDAVRDQPLDEAMVALFVRACQAAGQQARAFEAYHTARRRLADELGVDPGPELMAAHSQLLAPRVRPPGGGSAGACQDQPKASGNVVPAQLPPANLAFAGRTAELRRLDGFLTANSLTSAVTIVAIDGPAGIGKTTLALRWAHRLTGRYADGQIYVNLRGFGPIDDVVSAAEAARRFLDAFGVPPARIPADVHSQLDLYRSLLAGRRVLVMLDNARDSEQVHRLLPGAPGCLAIVTSRRRLSSLVATTGARSMTLDLLPADEARELLARHVGAERVAAEPEAVDRIVQRCGRLPLALAITAARAATQSRLPLAAFAGQLEDAGRDLDAFADTDIATDVRAAFTWSYRALHPPAAALFRVLSTHPGSDIGEPAIAALAGVSVHQARPSLSELADAYLVTEHAPARFLMHDLLRAYSAELAEIHDSVTDRRAAVERLLDHYLHTAHTAAMLTNPQLHPMDLPLLPTTAEPEAITDSRHAWMWFQDEWPNLLAAVHLAAGAGFDRHAWQLAWTLTNFLYRRGHWHELRASQTVALKAAQRLNEPVAQATSHRRLSAALNGLDQLDESAEHLIHALDLYTRLGDTLGQARAHTGLDRHYAFQDRHADALPHAIAAARLYQSAGHLDGYAGNLGAIAWDLAMLGRHQEALDLAGRALELLRRSGNRLDQAGAWDTIGYAQHHLDDHDEALVSYRRAIELFHENGDLYAESVSWLHAGDTHQVIGNPEQARDAWRIALEILNQLDHRDAEKARMRLDAARES
jgi:DNA-binding SARP family transcriptional activator/tetratricopeptide (TPR) repeat protein